MRTYLVGRAKEKFASGVRMGYRGCPMPGEFKCPIAVTEESPLMKRLFQEAVPVLIGLLLLAAAMLKADGVLLEEKLHDGLLGNRIFLIAVVAGEFAMAAWLLSGMAAGWCRRVTLALFALFALVALTKGLGGEASCGCFGQFEVNPWWTLMLDLGLFAALWFIHPTEENVAGGAASATAPGLGRMPRARLILAVAFCLLVAVPTTGRMIGSRTSALNAEGVIVGSGGLVILEPEKWIGRPLPIVLHIDIGSQLASGRWTIVLYHHDCPKCQEALPKYEQLASRHASKPDPVRIALVEVPPYGRMPGHEHGTTPTACGRLSSKREWFVQAPVEITLEHGVVKTASTELPSLVFGDGGLGEEWHRSKLPASTRVLVKSRSIEREIAPHSATVAAGMRPFSNRLP